MTEETSVAPGTSGARRRDGARIVRSAEVLFAGPGEMRALCRACDWAATPLGPVEGWSQALHTTAGTVLGSRNPMFLWWGPELVQLYNDAYRPSLGRGDRHPRALGARGREFWTDIWDAIGPQIAQVMSGGDATWHEDQYLPIERNGRREDVWWTYSYSPVRDDDGSIGGTLVVCQETTARVLAEAERERLRAETTRAERHSARILEQVSDAHVTLDREFRFVTVNSAAERALAKARGELVGRTHWEVFPASADADAGRAYRRVVAERVEQHVTQHYVGEGYDVHLEIDAYPTDDGGVAIFWRDVTERLRAEAARTRTEAVLASIADPFYLLDREWRFTYVNDAAEPLLQTTRAALLGRTLWEAFPEVAGSVFEGPYREAMATGRPTSAEAYYAPLGTWFDVHSYPWAGGLMVHFRDIGARKAAEAERERLLRALEVERARLEEVFRRAPSFIVAFRGPEQVYEFVNEAYYQLVGHRAIIGKPLVEAIPEIRGQGFERLLGRVLETGEPWVGRETPVQLQRTPGAPLETRYLDMVFQALAEADGTRSGVVVHGSDITAQVLARNEVERLLGESERARAEAEAARLDAEAANRAKSEFLAVMSHELRTPLNAIGGYADLIEMGVRGPITPQQREDLRRIQASQRHLLGLINEVLNYAKLESGSVHFDITGVPLREALVAAEALVAPQARAKALVLEITDAPPDLTARADAEKLRQILVNLLSNAIKFTDARGGRPGMIELSSAAEGAGVVVRIRDTGIGIPPDRVEAIFDPFVQVRADLTRTAEGTGLGLAISRDLARAMGGDLTVESAVGMGSTFTLVLPRA